ncbi:tail fiber domain-containing protein [Pedobacter metabolipauper]|uniref:Endosialidase-like protein n=1 Tax=Pedobacter metabolipauper TaxID=425513 RepID=A0A4R6SVH2_9SPHI|nr:tail fiber domain-containing protein [Pedobacter metabolipauper]TDQ08760.1 endosialidase-like protein [Pedobacter metabolipauper]
MNHLVSKSLGTGFLISLFALSANAQKIEEQQLKQQVNKVPNAVQRLNSLKPITFKYDTQTFKHLKLPATLQYGFLSPDVKSVFPELVYEASRFYDGGKNESKIAKYDAVETESLIPVLVAAIQEQQEAIEQLKKEVQLLKTQAK